MAYVKAMFMPWVALGVGAILAVGQNAYWRTWKVDLEPLNQWVNLFEFWSRVILFVGVVCALAWGLYSARQPPILVSYRRVRRMWLAMYIPLGALWIVGTVVVFMYPSILYSGLVEATKQTPPGYMIVSIPYLLDALLPYWVATAALAPKKFAYIPTPALQR